MDPKDLEGWKQLTKCESWGGMGNYGVMILVKMPRDIVEGDNKNYTEAIMQNLLKNTVLRDPDLVKRVEEMRQKFSALFEQPILQEMIPNQYCSQYCCLDTPWFRVTTRIGRFILGWRKRVISIDYSGTALQASALEAFPDEDTTRDGRLIHAWSYDKAKDYIQRIHSLSDLQPESQKIIRS